MSEAQDHERWDELAAGHALHALEPEETELFTAHLAACARCKDGLADHSFVAAQLGNLVDDHDDLPSWDRIRAGVLPGVPATAAAELPEPSPVVSLAEVRARRRAPRLLAAAASLLLVTGGAVVAWQTTQDGTQNAQEQVLAACAEQSGCRVVHLQDKADVVISDGAARLLATSLAPPAAGHVYVLWQLPRTGPPTMVGTLDGTAAGTVGEAHALAMPYEDTAAFGLSLEPASAVPTSPTDVVAVGNA